MSAELEARAENKPDRRQVLERSFYCSIAGSPYERSDLDYTESLHDGRSAFIASLKDERADDWYELQGLTKRFRDGQSSEDDKGLLLEKYSSDFANFILGNENKVEGSKE